MHALQEMKRALFIFAKLNPGLRYVQGMNELLAPLYYHFRLDPDRDNSVHAEADAFFCFMDIISEFRDNFCQQLVCLCVRPPALSTQPAASKGHSARKRLHCLEPSQRAGPERTPMLAGQQRGRHQGHNIPLVCPAADP